ncbi:hypothetical protein Moror_17845 [Moniliophthora roreri MCA 2997]|uniref:Uncharacterized protein n=2 Tax=Moniliophthora roreri TaxID=221103 RepID=V2XXL4_MONRO|nr:hypothetical protein Moror_17845 [Moniliophthora roreri MCA 2997]
MFPSTPNEASGITSPNGSTFKRMQRMDEFFISGGDAHFVVGEYYYRVHSYFFVRESPKFQQALAQCYTGGRGSSVTTAIKLTIATPEEFNKFLWVFYNPIHGVYKAPVSDWTDILKLAHLWEFPEIKALAVRELQALDMPAVDRISLYEKFGVDQAFCLPFYSELCSRDYPLDHEESMKLGFRTTFIIFRAREALRSRPTSMDGRSPLPPNVDNDDAVRTIGNLLAESPATATNGAHLANGLPSRPGSPFL